MPSVAAMAKHAAKLFSPWRRRKLALSEKPGQDEIGVVGARGELTRVSENSSSKGDADWWSGGKAGHGCRDTVHCEGPGLGVVPEGVRGLIAILRSGRVDSAGTGRSPPASKASPRSITDRSLGLWWSREPSWGPPSEYSLSFWTWLRPLWDSCTK